MSGKPCLRSVRGKGRVSGALCLRSTLVNVHFSLLTGILELFLGEALHFFRRLLRRIPLYRPDGLPPWYLELWRTAAFKCAHAVSNLPAGGQRIVDASKNLRPSI
jgi:hypothetical protein